MYRFKFFLCLLLLMGITVTAVADPAVQSMADPNADNMWIRPNLKVVNNDATPMNMAEYTVEYYFFEDDVSLSTLGASVWQYGLGNTSDVQVSFEALDPAFETGEKKANFVARIQFSGGVLSAGNSVEIGLGINAISDWQWHTFNQQDDWSYAASTGFLENENIVLSDAEGNVVFGDAPGEDTVPRPYATAIYWLGAHATAEMNEITVNEGDAYRNTDDGKAYVYYQNAWMLLDDNALSGGEMADSDSHLNMNGANVVNAGTVQSSTATISGSIEAGSFVGDGSGLTNLQLADGSILFDHLNQSTLDALVAYIAARLPSQQAIVSVIANPVDGVFELRRSGDTNSALVISYTVTQSSGTTVDMTAAFGVGADLVLVNAHGGETISLVPNPSLYEIDPLHASASMPTITVSMEIDSVADYTLRFERDFAPAEGMDLSLRRTTRDGTVTTTTAHWSEASPDQISLSWDDVGYGDLIELLPSTDYDIAPGSDSVEFPIVEIYMDINSIEDYSLRLIRDFAPPEGMSYAMRVYHLDGTSNGGSTFWAGDQPNDIISYWDAIGYGDRVELLPSPWYTIVPGSETVQFPLAEVTMEIDSVEDYRLRLTRDVNPIEGLEFALRVTHRNGTMEEAPFSWPGDYPDEVFIYWEHMGYGDRVELVPSELYTIAPGSEAVEFPIAQVSLMAGDPEDHTIRLIAGFLPSEGLGLRLHVTHADGSVNHMGLLWDTAPLDMLLVWDAVGVGDFVEILPDPYYILDPDHYSIQY